MLSDLYCLSGVTAVWSEPAYWKNGSLNMLPCPYKDVSVFGIGAAGSDVYVAGSAYNNGQYMAIYWKNRDMVALSDTGTIYAVAVGQ